MTTPPGLSLQHFTFWPEEATTHLLPVPFQEVCISMLVTDSGIILVFVGESVLWLLPQITVEFP
jgi:hypothetical protein